MIKLLRSFNNEVKMKTEHVCKTNKGLYRLHVEDGRLIVAINPDYIGILNETLGGISRNHEGIIPFQTGPWGYESCIQPTQESAWGWKQYEITAPKDTSSTPASQYGVSLSLGILFFSLLACSKAVREPDPQYLLIESMGYKQEPQGCSLSVLITERGAQLLQQERLQIDTEAIRRLMRRIFNRVGGARPHINAFQCMIDADGHIRMQVPGDACYLMVDVLEDSQAGEGYRLITQNCDTPAQQLALLWGVAYLEDQLRNSPRA